MVVDTMTYKEIWSEIRKDYNGIIRYKIVDAEKVFRKKVMASPSTLDIIRLKPIHFKSRKTSLNHCMILYSFGKNDYKKNGMLFVLYSYIYREYGIYAFMLSGKNFDTLAVYTPHFFSRYRERYIKDTSLSMDEVMEDFFVYNNVCQIKDVNNASYPNSIFASTKDGVLLGTKHPDNILEFKTFLPSELLKEQQIDLHNSQNEDVKKYLEEIYGTNTLKEQKPFMIIPITKVN